MSQFGTREERLRAMSAEQIEDVYRALNWALESSKEEIAASLEDIDQEIIRRGKLYAELRGRSGHK